MLEDSLIQLLLGLWASMKRYWHIFFDQTKGREQPVLRHLGVTIPRSCKACTGSSHLVSTPDAELGPGQGTDVCSALPTAWQPHSGCGPHTSAPSHLSSLPCPHQARTARLGCRAWSSQFEPQPDPQQIVEFLPCLAFLCLDFFICKMYIITFYSSMSRSKEVTRTKYLECSRFSIWAVTFDAIMKLSPHHHAGH